MIHHPVHFFDQGVAPCLVVCLHPRPSGCHFCWLLLVSLCGPSFDKFGPCLNGAVVTSLWVLILLPMCFPYGMGYGLMATQLFVNSIRVKGRIKLVLCIQLPMNQSFFKDGVFFLALFAQIDKFVCHFFCCCMPPSLQMCLLLWKFDCCWMSSGQWLFHLPCKCWLCLSVHVPRQVLFCCRCALWIAYKVGRTLQCRLWRHAQIHGIARALGLMKNNRTTDVAFTHHIRVTFRDSFSILQCN